MSITLIDIENAYEELGTSFRSRRRGPELDLLDWFLEQEYLRIPKGCRATVFREPRIDSGFPDLVIVVWNEERTKHWNSMRTQLGKHEFKLMHYLFRRRRATLRELQSDFQRRVWTKIDRLEAAELVRRSGDLWIPADLVTAFSATRILAIEAKVDERYRVLEQAFLNTWFASHSYILLPHPPERNDFVETATTLGIGVWGRNNHMLQEIEAATPGRLPRSYASWVLNEWAWRATCFGEKTAQ